MTPMSLNKATPEKIIRPFVASLSNHNQGAHYTDRTAASSRQQLPTSSLDIPQISGVMFTPLARLPQRTQHRTHGAGLPADPQNRSWRKSRFPHRRGTSPAAYLFKKGNHLTSNLTGFSLQKRNKSLPRYACLKTIAMLTHLILRLILAPWFRLCQIR
jgi:hypothetical protein